MEDLIKRFLAIEPLGYGYGYGYGDGSKLHSVICEEVDLKDYRKGFIDKQIATLKKFNGNDVYYVDNIPCYFLAIKDGLAKVKIIKDDFTTEVRYISKQGNLFAHGKTKEEASQSVLDKHFASLSFAEKKSEFIKKFKKNDKHKANIFFDWHHILTGSCKSGRLDFIQSRGISLESEMTVLDFLQVTQNEYNGAIIKEILSEIT